jgi:hypothetical protein
MKQAIPRVDDIKVLMITNCVQTIGYNAGAGTGELSWAPIMGIAYSRNLTTWYNGPSSLGCTEFQNDL